MKISTGLLALTGGAAAFTTSRRDADLENSFSSLSSASVGASGRPGHRFLTRRNVSSSSSSFSHMSDAELLDHLDQRHAEALDAYNKGNNTDGSIIWLEQWVADNIGSSTHTVEEKRQLQLLLAGVAILPMVEMGDDVIHALVTTLSGSFRDAIVWESKEHCRTYFETHGGGQNWIKTAKEGEDFSSNSDSHTHWMNGVGWDKPTEHDPPIQYFTDEDGIGTFSVQYTATDTVAWPKIKGTETCYFQGLCNPQYMFHRNGYYIVLNTWQSNGDVTSCQYSQGQDCKGLCDQGIQNEFVSGGLTWGGSCAIPCVGDAEGGTGTVPAH